MASQCSSAVALRKICCSFLYIYIFFLNLILSSNVSRNMFTEEGGEGKEKRRRRITIVLLVSILTAQSRTTTNDSSNVDFDLYKT